MNLYIRYFDEETVVPGVEEAVEYLRSLNIDDFNIDEAFIADLEEFVNSSVSFPKRYKVKAHYYFLVIKTNVTTLEEFKRNNAKNMLESEVENLAKKPVRAIPLSTIQPGWYEGQLCFKRVISNIITGKSQYRDTVFRALVKAESPQHCYDRIVSYLRTREDIDERSQFPSAKNKSFTFTYVGTQRPTDWEM